MNRQVTAEELQRGDLVLFAPDGSLSATFIDVFTHSHYHHIAIYAGEGMVIEAMPGGVRRYPLGTRQMIGIQLDILPPQKLIAEVWATSKVGDPYDSRALLMIGFDRIFPHLRRGNPAANRYTCAVFVSEAYHHAGIDLLAGRDWNDLVPGDFLQLLREPAKLAIPD